VSIHHIPSRDTTTQLGRPTALIFKPASLRHRPHRQRARRRAPSSKLCVILHFTLFFPLFSFFPRSHSDYLIAIHAVPGIRLQRSGVPLPQRSQAAPKTHLHWFRTRAPRPAAHDPTVPSIGVLPRTLAHFIVTQRRPIPRPTQSHALRHHRWRLHSSLQHHDRAPAVYRAQWHARIAPRTTTCTSMTVSTPPSPTAPPAASLQPRPPPIPFTSPLSSTPSLCHPAPPLRHPPRSRSCPPCLPKRHADARCSGRLGSPTTIR
jgi:hypothetical protein